MEKENQVVPRQQTSPPTGIGEDLKNSINGLFGTIKIAYPNFMKDQDVSLAKRMWALHLEGTPISQIESATVVMIDRHPTFPPTLGEFKAIIKELNVARPEHEEVGPLRLKYDGNDKIAYRALDQLRKLTGAKKLSRKP